MCWNTSQFGCKIVFVLIVLSSIVYIIADMNFEGNYMAFEMKASRQAEWDLMQIKFDLKKGHFCSLEMIEALLGDEENWDHWKKQKDLYEKKYMSK